MIELRRSWLWLSLPCLFLIVAAFSLFVYGIGDLHKARNATNITARRLLAAEVLLSDLKDAETGQRGYLLTEDPTYLAPYNDALVRVNKSRASLDELLRLPPLPLSQYQNLAPLIQAKLDELARTIELARQGHLDQAMVIVRSNRGKQIMDDIRREIGAIRGQAQEAITLRGAEEEQVLWWTGAATIGLGSVAFVVAMALSVSLLRISGQLKRRDEQLDLALTSASAGLWQVDCVTGEGRWSPQMFGLMGLATPSTTQQGRLSLVGDWRSVIHPDDIATVETEIRTSLETHRPFRMDHRIIRPDGEVRWLATAGRFMTRPATVMNGLAIDVTTEKLAADQVRESQAAAAQAGEVKSRFLAAASHDLQQPLQSMFLFAASLDYLVTTGPARELLDHIESGMDVLNELLEQLLNVSRLDAGKVTPHWDEFPIIGLLEKIAAASTPLAAEKGLVFSARPCTAMVRSDATMLGQILRNLVSNAIRYTDHGTVELNCAVVDGQLRLTVRDTGIGIPPEQIDHIWDEFHQVGNASRDRELGLGLGLAIVKRLAKLLDHPIVVESVPGKGSSFMVEVPRAVDQTAAHPVAGERVALEEGNGKVALIVDDDALVLKGICALATAWGYKVLAATSLAEAMNKITYGNYPHILVCDYRLGASESGLDVIAKVREVCGRVIPGIVITGDTEGQLGAAVARLGVEILYKPILPDQLAQALRARAA